MARRNNDSQSDLVAAASFGSYQHSETSGSGGGGAGAGSFGGHHSPADAHFGPSAVAAAAAGAGSRSSPPGVGSGGGGGGVFGVGGPSFGSSASAATFDSVGGAGAGGMGGMMQSASFVPSASTAGLFGPSRSMSMGAPTVSSGSTATSGSGSGSASSGGASSRVTASSSGGGGVSARSPRIGLHSKVSNVLALRAGASDELSSPAQLTGVASMQVNAPAMFLPDLVPPPSVSVASPVTASGGSAGGSPAVASGGAGGGGAAMLSAPGPRSGLGSRNPSGMLVGGGDLSRQPSAYDYLGESMLRSMEDRPMTPMDPAGGGRGAGGFSDRNRRRVSQDTQPTSDHLGSPNDGALSTPTSAANTADNGRRSRDDDEDQRVTSAGSMNNLLLPPKQAGHRRKSKGGKGGLSKSKSFRRKAHQQQKAEEEEAARQQQQQKDARRARRFSAHQDAEFKKTNVIDSISVAELEKMNNLFKKFDKDGSGSIDEEELVPLLAELGHPMSRVQSNDLLAQVDANGNGELEFSEFLQLVLIFKNVAQFRLYEDGAEGGGSGGSGGGGGTGGQGGEDFGSPGAFQDELGGSAFALSSTAGGGALAWLPTCCPNAVRNLFPLNHESGALWAWEVLLLATCVYIWCSVTAVYAFADIHLAMGTMARRFDASDIVVTVIIVVEILRQCVTRVRVYNRNRQARMIVAVRDIMEHYCFSPRFALDVLAVVPLRLAAGENSALAGLLLSHLRLLFLWHLSAIMNRRSFADIDRWFVYFFLSWAPIVVGIAAFLCVVHVCAIAAFRVLLARTYAESVYVVLYCFSGAGFGDIEPQSNEHRIFLSVLCLMSMLVNGFVIGSIVSFFATSDVDSVRKSRLVQTLAVLDFFQVPTPLQEEILQFQNHLMAKNIQAAFGSVTENLPPEMRVGLGLQVRIQLVRSLELFRMAHPSTQIALAQELFTVVLCPEEFVALAQEEGEELYFIAYGFIDVLTAGGVYVQTLKMYESFGAEVVLGPIEDAARRHRELGLDDDAPLDIRTWGKYEYSAKTLTYVELLGLNVPTFDLILRQFPRFKSTVCRVLAERGSALRKFGTKIKRRFQQTAEAALLQEAEQLLHLQRQLQEQEQQQQQQQHQEQLQDQHLLYPDTAESPAAAVAAADVPTSLLSREESSSIHIQIGSDGGGVGSAPGSPTSPTTGLGRRLMSGHAGSFKKHARAEHSLSGRPELLDKLKELNVDDIFGGGGGGSQDESERGEEEEEYDEEEEEGHDEGEGEGEGELADVVITPEVREQWLAELERIEVTLHSAVAEAATQCLEVQLESDDDDDADADLAAVGSARAAGVGVGVGIGVAIGAEQLPMPQLSVDHQHVTPPATADPNAPSGGRASSALTTAAAANGRGSGGGALPAANMSITSRGSTEAGNFGDHDDVDDDVDVSDV